MEESIKIVEEILEDLKANRIHGQFTQEQIVKENQAIEQLIKGYKNAVKINKEQANIIATANIAIKDLQEKLKDSIQKSKIREKIEAIIQEENDEWDGTDYTITSEANYAIEVLEEFLEDQ